MDGKIKQDLIIELVKELRKQDVEIDKIFQERKEIRLKSQKLGIYDELYNELHNDKNPHHTF